MFSVLSSFLLLSTWEKYRAAEVYLEEKISIHILNLITYLSFKLKILVLGADATLFGGWPKVGIIAYVSEDI